MILGILYIFFGIKAVRYVKRNIFGVAFEVTHDLFTYWLSQFIWGVIMGWLAIPVMIIHWIFVGRKN